MFSYIETWGIYDIWLGLFSDENREIYTLQEER